MTCSVTYDIIFRRCHGLHCDLELERAYSTRVTVIIYRAELTCCLIVTYVLIIHWNFFFYSVLICSVIGGIEKKSGRKSGQ